NSGISLAGMANAQSDFSGGRDTAAGILTGTSTVATTLDTRFATHSGASNDLLRLSDVYSLDGIENNDLFVLGLSMTSVGPNSILGWLDTITNTWVNAVDGINGAMTTTFVSGSYNAATDFHAGYYGVDTNTGSVWAVIDQDGDFTVIAVPEPSESVLVVAG